MAPQQYYQLFSRYVLSQHIICLSEAATSSTGSMKTSTPTPMSGSPRIMLIAKNKQVGRGNYYNHSGFADPLITGLIGLRPRADNRSSCTRCCPPAWSYFAIDALPYHGHLLAVVLDRTGEPLPPRQGPDALCGR